MGNEGGSVRPGSAGGGQVIEHRTYLQVDGRTLAEAIDRYAMSVQ
jgi:hypothetical protein